MCVKSKGVERGDFVTDLSWSTNHVATKKDLENCSTAVLDKDEHLSGKFTYTRKQIGMVLKNLSKASVMKL